MFGLKFVLFSTHLSEDFSFKEGNVLCKIELILPAVPHQIEVNHIVGFLGNVDEETETSTKQENNETNENEQACSGKEQVKVSTKFVVTDSPKTASQGGKYAWVGKESNICEDMLSKFDEEKIETALFRLIRFFQKEQQFSSFEFSSSFVN